MPKGWSFQQMMLGTLAGHTQTECIQALTLHHVQKLAQKESAS